MLKQLLRLLIVGMALLLIAEPCWDAQAAGKPAKSAKAKKAAKGKTTSLQGKIEAVDKMAKTITLESKGKTNVFLITSKTHIFKNDKPATFDQDVVTNEEARVQGHLNKTDGPSEAINVWIGAKAQGKHKSSKTKAAPVEKKAETPQ